MCVIHAQEPYLVSEYKCSFSYSEAQEENPEAALVFLKHPTGWLIIFDRSDMNYLLIRYAVTSNLTSMNVDNNIYLTSLL